jgi:hypothetical protein
MTEFEAERLWTGYENFLDSIAGLDDDERTIAMEVGSF